MRVSELDPSDADPVDGKMDARQSSSLVQVRLLGAVDVTVDGVPVDLSGIRRKAVLAALAIGAGQAISSDLLIDIVWSGRAPATVTNTLQSHISYLRRVLGSSHSIVSAAPGYRLLLGADGTDIQIVDRLITKAASIAEPEGKASLLRAALAMWRAEPMADIRGHSWIDEHAGRLERKRQAARKALMDARLLLGEHAALIPVLEDLSMENPFDEDLIGQLMVALYRAGRQADALLVFRRTRSRLADELGIDPARSLRDLEQSILRQDPTLDLTQPGVVVGNSADALLAPTVAQLPHVTGEMVGRSQELGILDAVLHRVRTNTATAAAPTVAISGMAGVGKSTLALSWAHGSRRHFPDGQLYVDLGGFDIAAQPLDPREALTRCLNAFGVSTKQIPTDLGSLIGLYRTVLSGKRVLVVLDNAHSTEQVRPLLPSTSGCMAVVTSRTDLGPLAVTNSAHQLRLEPLSTRESRALLRSRQDGTCARSSDAEDHILQYCGGLPLALAISASRLLAYPCNELLVSSHQPQNGSQILDALSGGDPSTDLRSIFSGSCRWLTKPAVALFRLLSVSSLGQAARLCRPGQNEALAELVRHNLVQRDDAGKHTIHPLLRHYGAELVVDSRASAREFR